MKSKHVEESNESLLRAYESFDAMDAWGVLRKSKERLPAAELAKRLGITLQATQAALDLAETAGLVKKLRAGGGQRAITYASVKEAIDVVLPRRPETEPEFEKWMMAAARHQEAVLRRMIPFTQRNRGGGDRFWTYATEFRASKADWEELLRRGAAFTRFLEEIIARMETPAADGGELSREHALFIRIGPLSGPMKPVPLIRMRSDAAQDAIRAGRAEVPATLSPREVEIASMLQRGLSRAEVAKQLGISVETVASYCKSFFKKLGIKRATELSLFSFETKLGRSEGPEKSRG